MTFLCSGSVFCLFLALCFLACALTAAHPSTSTPFGLFSITFITYFSSILSFRLTEYTPLSICHLFCLLALCPCAHLLSPSERRLMFTRNSRFTGRKISLVGWALLKTEWKEKKRRGVRNRQKRWKRTEKASGSWAMDALFFRRKDFKGLSLTVTYRQPTRTHTCKFSCLPLYIIAVHLRVWEYVINLISGDDFT